MEGRTGDRLAAGFGEDGNGNRCRGLPIGAGARVTMAVLCVAIATRVVYRGNEHQHIAAVSQRKGEAPVAEVQR